MLRTLVIMISRMIGTSGFSDENGVFGNHNVAIRQRQSNLQSRAMLPSSLLELSRSFGCGHGAFFLRVSLRASRIAFHAALSPYMAFKAPTATRNVSSVTLIFV